MNILLRKLFLSLGLAILAIPASAMSLDYALGSGNGTAHGSGPGNVYDFVDQGVTLETSAWATLGNDLFQQATVTQFGQGLGICNGREGALDDCLASPRRFQVDNRGAGQQDWMLLLLSETVRFDEIVLDTLGLGDRDVTYWLGDLPHQADLIGAEFADLLGLGLGNAQTVFNPQGPGLLSLDLGGQEGNALLIGARLGDNDDGFLLSSLEATVVPVPAAIWLFGSALGYVGMRKRRHVGAVK